MTHSLEAKQQIRRLYLFSFFWMFLVFIPVFVPFVISKGLDMKDLFTLQVVFSASTLLLEVPSGYASDLLGRKKTLMLGSIFAGLGYTWFYFVQDFWGLVLFEVCLGVAISMASGTDVSLLYDWLKSQDQDNDRALSTTILANRQLAMTSSEALGSILGGLLVMISFQAVQSVQMLMGWLPFFIVLSLKEPHYEKMETTQHRDNFKKVLSHIFLEDPLLKWVFINLIVWGLSTFVAVWTFQKHWMESSLPLASFGFIWAGYNLVVGLVGKQVPYFEKKWGARNMVFILTGLPILGYLGLALLTGWWGVLVGLCFQFSRGITQVILKDALNWRTPSAFRATVNSLSSLFFRLGFVLLGPLMGWMIDAWALSTALLLMGGFFVLAFLALTLPLLRCLPQEIPPQ